MLGMREEIFQTALSTLPEGLKILSNSSSVFSLEHFSLASKRENSEIVRIYPNPAPQLSIVNSPPCHLVRDGIEDAIDIRRDAVWQKHSPETEVARRRLSIREWLSRKRVRRERRDKRDKRGGTLRRRAKAVDEKPCEKLPPASKLQSSARGSDRRPPINQMERRLLLLLLAAREKLRK